MSQDLVKEARSRAMKYCSVAERSPSQVREKLVSYGLSSSQADVLVEELKSENFLSEHRFAHAFCHDKLEFNHWGRIKIKSEISRYGIGKEALMSALSGMNEERYVEILTNLLQKRWDSLGGKGLTLIMRLHKVMSFGLGRGFEPDLIRQILGELS